MLSSSAFKALSQSTRISGSNNNNNHWINIKHTHHWNSSHQAMTNTSFVMSFSAVICHPPWIAAVRGKLGFSIWPKHTQESNHPPSCLWTICSISWATSTKFKINNVKKRLPCDLWLNSRWSQLDSSADGLTWPSVQYCYCDADLLLKDPLIDVARFNSLWKYLSFDRETAELRFVLKQSSILC